MLNGNFPLRSLRFLSSEALGEEDFAFFAVKRIYL
jgi:hypothetical protein